MTPPGGSEIPRRTWSCTILRYHVSRRIWKRSPVVVARPLCSSRHFAVNPATQGKGSEMPSYASCRIPADDHVQKQQGTFTWSGNNRQGNPPGKMKNWLWRQLMTPMMTKYSMYYYPKQPPPTAAVACEPLLFSIVVDWVEIGIVSQLTTHVTKIRKHSAKRFGPLLRPVVCGKWVVIGGIESVVHHLQIPDLRSRIPMAFSIHSFMNKCIGLAFMDYCWLRFHVVGYGTKDA